MRRYEIAWAVMRSVYAAPPTEEWTTQRLEHTAAVRVYRSLDKATAELQRLNAENTDECVMYGVQQTELDYALLDPDD